MKHCFALILLITLFMPALIAQPGRTIRVKAGEDAAQAYSPSGFYRFPQFGKAHLYFNGTSRRSDILFNYNLYSGRIQFINPRGDTLDLVNATSPDSIVFETSKFVYRDGFLEVIEQSDSLKLVKKLVLKAQVESIGAYGQPNPTGSITNVKSIFTDGAVFSLVVNADIVLTEDINWFFINGRGEPLKANKTNLLKLLPTEKQARAESYLKQNRVSFQKEQDLKGLVAAIRS
jgi:hypothetical protein